MKFGIRTPSPRKSISARTKGRVTRSVKSYTRPAYGKKGMGLVANPRKSVYNKAYNKTSVNAFEAVGCIMVVIAVVVFVAAISFIKGLLG